MELIKLYSLTLSLTRRRMKSTGLHTREGDKRARCIFPFVVCMFALKREWKREPQIDPPPINLWGGGESINDADDHHQRRVNPNIEWPRAPLCAFSLSPLDDISKDLSKQNFSESREKEKKQIRVRTFFWKVSAILVRAQKCSTCLDVDVVVFLLLLLEAE